MNFFPFGHVNTSNIAGEKEACMKSKPATANFIHVI